MPNVTIRLLGAPRIERNGKPVEFDTRKAIGLLALLTMTDQAQSREHLAALLWPEADTAHAQGDLRRTLFSLRQGIGKDCILADRNTIALNLEAVWVDVRDFRDQLARLSNQNQSHQPKVLSALSAAVSLSRGAFMESFVLRDSAEFEDWQLREGERLQRELADALEVLAWGYSACGDYAMAITHARHWLALDALREDAYCCLMTLLARTGKRDDALRQFADCRRALDRELGVPPLVATSQLYERIKTGELTEIKPLAGVISLSAPMQRPTTMTMPNRFVGRVDELAALAHAYAERSDGYFFAIEGEVGIGKTHLAEEFIEQMKGHGAVTLVARCYPAQAKLAYSPFIDALRAALDAPALDRLRQLPAHWLAEGARLLPELATLATRSELIPSADTPNAPARFFEGLRQVLLTFAKTAPVIVLLDDVHWMDDASLDLLTYLVHRLPNSNLFVLATWRREETSPLHPLRQLLFDTQRVERASIRSLPRLSAEDIVQLIRDDDSLGIKTQRQTVAFARRLHAETEGVPLFVSAYLSELRQHVIQFNAQSWRMPDSVRNVLTARLANVGEVVHQMLQTAAVIGHLFSFDLVRHASGRSDDEIVTALEIATAHGIVREVNAADGIVRYDFTHDKLCTQAYAELSSVRRKLLHARIADALRKPASSRIFDGALASQIARHLYLAGNGAEATSYYMQAGSFARSIFANAEALAHFQSALALGQGDILSLRESIGDLQVLIGNYSDALQSFASAEVLSETDLEKARIAHKQANVHQRCGDWQAAEDAFTAAMVYAKRKGGMQLRARLLSDWSHTAYRNGDNKRAVQLANSALTTATRSKDVHAQAQAHNMLGLMARSKGDLRQAHRHLERSLVIAEQLRDPDAQVAALNNLAHVLRENDQIDEGIRLTEQALALCQAYGDRHREAALRSNLADLLRADGQLEAAMAQLKLAVTLFADVQSGESDRMSGIWRLIEW